MTSLQTDPGPEPESFTPEWRADVLVNVATLAKSTRRPCFIYPEV